MGLTREELWKLRLRDAKQGITEALSETTYSRQAIESILAEHRDEWRFPRTLHTEYFLEYLARSKVFRRHLFTRVTDQTAETYPREMTLYAKSACTEFDIALGLRSKSYLSHLSAAYLHGLTNLVPKVFYTNREQVPKSVQKQSESNLSQEAVDRVFAKPARTTALAYTDGNIRVVLVAGMFTDRLEVHDTPSPDGEQLYPATSLERTLIDCTVRASQAGGIHEVLNMYEAAREQLSVKRLRRVLDQLGFIYPYRQAIGFLLERANYPEKQVALFERPTFNIDFYLDYAMAETTYSERWRLHHPSGF